ALWRGPVLADAAVVEAAHGEITRLEELRLTAVTVRTKASLALGRHADVVPELTRLVVKHPLHEPFYVLLMIALFRCGRRADALAVYRRARNVLAREEQMAPRPVQFGVVADQAAHLESGLFLQPLSDLPLQLGRLPVAGEDGVAALQMGTQVAVPEFGERGP